MLEDLLDHLFLLDKSISVRLSMQTNFYLLQYAKILSLFPYGPNVPVNELGQVPYVLVTYLPVPPLEHLGV
jgi:hypothetical protein